MRACVCAFREVKLMMMMVNLFPFPGITFAVTFFLGGGRTTKYSYIILVYFWSLSAVLPFVEKDPVNQQHRLNRPDFYVSPQSPLWDQRLTNNSGCLGTEAVLTGIISSSNTYEPFVFLSFGFKGEKKKGGKG